MARWCLIVRRVRFLATSWGVYEQHELQENVESGERRTSEIPFLCMRLNRIVQAILRGFLRWRNNDSDLPLKNLKTLESPRT